MIWLEPRIRRKLLAAVIVTVLFGLSIGEMYILWARFHPTYFYIALGTYVVLLALALLLVGRKPKDLDQEVERDLEQTTSRAGEFSPGGGARSPVAVLDSVDGVPLQVEKATGMVARTTAAQPIAYATRGFTLYERVTAKGQQRFFAQGKPVGGGRPIPLPEGYRAVWDAKKRRPFLEEIPKPEPQPTPEAPEPAFEVNKPQAKMPTGIRVASREGPADADAAAARPRPCGAFTSPGTMCSRPAREGSPYCALHAKHKPDAVMQDFVARRDTATGQHKPFRGSVGDFEVHLAKPNAKPLRFKAPTVDVQVARPSTHPAPTPEGSRAKPTPPRPKPLRSLMDRPFEVRLAKPSVKPLRVTGPGVPENRLDKPKAPKPLRPAARSEVVVNTARPNAKPMKLRQGREPVIRPAASLADAKPLRLKSSNDFDVETARGSLIAPSNRTVRCKATLASGKRCSNDARGGAIYCPQHKNFKPRIEAVVVRDTRTRTDFGVGDQDRVPAAKGRR